MKGRWAWLVLAVVYAAAFAANLGHFWWTWEDVGALQTGTTAVYLAVCVGLFLQRRNHPACMRWAVQLSGLTAVAGGLGLLVRIGGPTTSFLMLPALLLAGVFVTPLYGLLGLIPDFDLCYAAVAVLGLVWLAWGLYVRKDEAKCR